MSRRAWSVAFGLALAVATTILLAPGSALPPTGEGLVPHVDKIEHALLFAGLALLARRASAAPAWVVFVGLVAYGAFTEAAQAFVPERSADALDLLADAAGAATAFARIRRRPSPAP